MTTETPGTGPNPLYPTYLIGRANWSAIFGGVFMTVGIIVTLAALGLAAGLTLSPTATQVGVAVGIWTLAVIAGSIFFGALFSGPLSGATSRLESGVRGLVIWAFSLLILVYLAGSGLAAGAGSGIFEAVTSHGGAAAPQAAIWWFFITAVVSGVFGFLGGLAGAPSAYARRSAMVPAPGAARMGEPGLAPGVA